MKIALIPGTERPETVLAGLGTTIVGLAEQKTIDLDLFGAGWAMHANCEIFGDLRDAALREIDAYCRRLTGAPEGPSLTDGPDHPASYDRWYNKNSELGRHRRIWHLSGDISGSVSVTGLAPNPDSGPLSPRAETQSLTPVSVKSGVRFAQVDGLLHPSPLRSKGAADPQSTGLARQKLARELLEMDALVLYLGSDRPVTGRHANELRNVVGEMAAQAALGCNESKIDPHDRPWPLKRIVLAIGNVGASHPNPDVLLYESDPEDMFHSSMLKTLIQHRDLLLEVAHLAGNLHIKSHQTDPHQSVLCVPTDLLGDLRTPRQLNRDPLLVDHPLLRSRDFPRLRDSNLDGLFQAMIDMLRERWRPFNFATPVICAASGILSPLAMVLAPSDWEAIDAGVQSETARHRVLG